ncbi:carbohydrate ABC transporter substrate-binding protein [Paenibacillus sp. LHD-117]|uniref:carbohydrate ABC transporter substrate-binding protein n=1 Tax=Paenibacillus sp. LHD-117 TaxID=3071412 RepID=UPI0027E0EE34|nr:carbohydrate ABC transporter substrate-binding protein [Paenibacillus sp. LHD-117]MDQ6418902.1 carbohydrate ABC transporter substrate-binding protein [Paenibacillus sp. LHD-117]
MMLKKNAALGILLMVSLVWLTGCELAGTTPESSPETMKNAATGFANKELHIAVFEGAYGKSYWEAVVQRFEADYPGVNVTLIANPKIMDVIKPMNVSGNPPDFLYAPFTESTNTVRTMIASNSFMDLTGLFDTKALGKDVPLKDIMMDGILEYTKPYGDGKIYMAPNYVTTEGLWYNKTLFEQKGWKPPRTWDEFWALGDSAAHEGISLFTYPGIYPGYVGSMLWSAIASAGGLDDLTAITNYEKGSFGSESVKKVLDQLKKMADREALMPGTVALNHTQAQTEFLKNKALFIPNGSWFEGEMKDIPRAPGFEFGFLPSPTFGPDDQQYARISFEAMFIPKKAKNKELAMEFIKYQYRDDIIRLNAEKSTGVIAVKNGAELAKDVLPASVYDAATVFERGVKPFMFEWKVTPPTAFNITDEVFNPTNNIMKGDMSVDQWIDHVDKTFAKLRDLLDKVE